MPQWLSREHGSLFFKSARWWGSVLLDMIKGVFRKTHLLKHLSSILCLRSGIPWISLLGSVLFVQHPLRGIPDHQWTSSRDLQSLAGRRAWRRRMLGKCLGGFGLEKPSRGVTQNPLQPWQSQPLASGTFAWTFPYEEFLRMLCASAWASWLG